MTLQRDLTCPNCEGREIWRIETMRERGHATMKLPPMGVTCGDPVNGIHLIVNDVEKGPYR